MKTSKMVTSEEMKILKVAKKKRKVTCREYNWFTLMDMVHKRVLDKVIPDHGRYAGWPYFKISHYGKKVLKRAQKYERARSSKSS